jgi:cytochrome c
MMKSIAIALAAAAVLACGLEARAADAGEDLAKNSGCLACHSIDKKLVGPGYKDSANKYRGDKSAPANLAKKVKEGGKGVWGDIPMPPNAHVKDADIATIVNWVLNVK